MRLPRGSITSLSEIDPRVASLVTPDGVVHSESRKALTYRNQLVREKAALEREQSNHAKHNPDVVPSASNTPTWEEARRTQANRVAAKHQAALDKSTSLEQANLEFAGQAATELRKHLEGLVPSWSEFQARKVARPQCAPTNPSTKLELV